jgi:hypothetical protein
MDKVLASNRKAKMWDRMVELYTTGVPGMPGASINLVLKNDIHR